MVKAVIFDCFGVLYVDPSQAFYEENLADYDDLKQDLYEIDRRYDLGWMTSMERSEAASSLTGLDADAIEDALTGAYHRPNKKLIEYSQTLRPQLRVGMLSNIGTHGMDGYFSHEEQANLFDAAILSVDVGLIKPDPRVFVLAAQRLGVETSECVMIDDRSDNCDGARAAGMFAIHHQSNSDTIKQLRGMLDA